MAVTTCHPSGNGFGWQTGDTVSARSACTARRGIRIGPGACERLLEQPRTLLWHVAPLLLGKSGERREILVPYGDRELWHLGWPFYALAKPATNPTLDEQGLATVAFMPRFCTIHKTP